LLHSQWLCSLECLDQVLEDLLWPLIDSSQAASAAKVHRFPLGLLMLSLGLISKESLRMALRAQREAGKGRVGDWLRQHGVVTEPQVTRALAVQWSLPIYPLEKREANLNWAHLVPFPLLEAFQMLPVHSSPETGVLHVAFSNRVDHTALYAIEQILDCRTEPCVAQESHIERALAKLHQEGCSKDTLIEGPIEAPLISRATLQQASECGAEEVRVAGCANNIWVRLRDPAGARDLLFRPASHDSTRILENPKIHETGAPPFLESWVDRLY
jgi:hypothetical protein